MTPRHDPRANVAVIEAILIALVLLGSILFVLGFESPTTATPSSRQDLALQARDALQVLGSMHTSDGTYGGSRLDALVAQAALGDSTGLDHEVAGLLPGGATGRVVLDGGGALIVLSGDVPPSGATVTASRAYVPAWPSLFLRTGLAVYPSQVAAPMTVLGVPTREGLPVPTPFVVGAAVNFTNDHESAIEPQGFPWGVWGNRSVASAVSGSGYPVTGVTQVRSNWTLDGANLTGSAAYGVSSKTVVTLGYAPAHDGLRHASIVASPRNATLGGNVSLVYDLRPVANRLQANLTPIQGSFTVHLAVYSPAPDEAKTPTGWHVVANWTATSLNGTVTWSVPRGALLGTHVLEAELSYTLNDGGAGVPQAARALGIVTVGPPGVTGATTALYDLQLVAWYER